MDGIERFLCCFKNEDILQELLGLGIDLPGMISKGTLEREDDDGPAALAALAAAGGGNGGSTDLSRVRQTLAVRPEQQVVVRGSQHHLAVAGAASEQDAMSEGSEIMNESVVSSITDR